jgi:hypothetical protein
VADSEEVAKWVFLVVIFVILVTCLFFFLGSVRILSIHGSTAIGRVI